MTRQPQRQSGSTDHRSIPLAAVATLTMLGLGLLSGCATSKDELMPSNGMTMQQLWEQGSRVDGDGHRTGSPGQHVVDAARSALRRPLGDDEMRGQQESYTRNAANEIHSQFSRLPNPDLVMFVYPHLAGGESVPVPGYSTVFPLYNKAPYAMPGEGARPLGRTR